MRAVILAAGKGERLKPLSNHVTKAMMPVANVPMTERVVDQIAFETGIDEFVVVANGPDHDLVRHLIGLEESNSFQKNMTFRFAYQEEQRGMGHALKCGLGAVSMKEPFLLAACDSLYPPGEIARLLKSFGKSDCDACLALIEMQPDTMATSSTVRIEDGQVTEIVEKPSLDEVLSPYASLPLYVLGPEIADYLEKLEPSKRGELELQDALRIWIADRGRFSCEILSGRDTVTTIADLVALNTKYVRAASVPGAAEWGEAIVIEPALCGEKVVFGRGTVIGPNAVIGDGSRIGCECRVKDAVVFPGSMIPDGCIVENGCWHGDEFFPA